MPCVGSAPAARGLGGGGGGESGAYIGGCARGRVKPGSGARAGQTRIGKGPGQNRIGNTGGSNPKREKRHQEKEKNANLWLQPHSPESGVTAVRTVVITGLLATAVITAVDTVVPEGVVATKV